MIVAVEGPSAAGKTTWCARQPWPVVAEYAATGYEPDGSDENQALENRRDSAGDHRRPHRRAHSNQPNRND